MSFDLSKVLNGVSNLDTGANNRERLEYIDIGLIDSDPNNFYSLDGIDQLAANIELLGLQQPLRVRANPADSDRVIIVSGHRRRAALALLVEEGKTQFASVPCLREQDAGSESLQELRLIYANADTRAMTSAELSQQAERVEALLYQLKEEGVEFPGRMRDHVAEACKVSKSKLARLKVIREHLIEEFQPIYKANVLNESTAYELAQQPTEIQSFTLQMLKVQDDGRDNNPIEKLNANYVRQAVKVYNLYDPLVCAKDNQPCSNRGNMELKHMGLLHSYCSCEQYKCCMECPQLRHCKMACGKCAEKKARLKAEDDLRKEAEAAREKQEKMRTVVITNGIRKIWSIFAEARENAGVTIEEYLELFEIEYPSAETWRTMESGEYHFTRYSSTPYGTSCVANDMDCIQSLFLTADLFGCTVDHLVGRKSDSGPAWRHGEPPTSGWYTVIMDTGCSRSYQCFYFDNIRKVWSFDKATTRLVDNEFVHGWTPMPNEDA